MYDAGVKVHPRWLDMADWAEVRRLAADFQRLQASSTAHRLSERNCVELVSRLVERGLLEIVYTLDGKEYVTPGQLDREIRNELAVHGGNLAILWFLHTGR